MQSAEESTTLADWIAQRFGGVPPQSLIVIAGDASPRRYFRASYPAKTAHQPPITYIAVTSPASENNPAFVHVCRLLAEAGVRVPHLLHYDLDRGYLLLEDLGDETLLPLLSSDSVGAWYGMAFRALQLMVAIDPRAAALPLYDDQRLGTELNLFKDWFVQTLLNYPWQQAHELVFNQLSDILKRNAAEQPQVVVHRDFHSRNLMCLNNGELAVIDFQDAVIGPLTYDPVSLLKDCYVQWPRSRQLAWLRNYQVDMVAAGVLSATPDLETQFIRWFDLMGLQRHLKVLGIFARLALRDSKPNYLNDLPLVVAYVRQALTLYRESESSVASFADWFEAELMPLIVTQPWYNECTLQP